MGDSALTGGLYEGRRGKVLKELSPAESEIQKAITDLLELRSVVHAVTNAQTVQTTDGPRQLVRPEGWPDVTALLPVTGRLWAIEVKTDDGKLRESQVDMLALIEAAGGLVTVARDVAEVHVVLERHLAEIRPATPGGYWAKLSKLFTTYVLNASRRTSRGKRRRIQQPPSSQKVLL